MVRSAKPPEMVNGEEEERYIVIEREKGREGEGRKERGEREREREGREGVRDTCVSQLAEQKTNFSAQNGSQSKVVEFERNTGCRESEREMKEREKSE
eukprot:sb/3478915/